MSFPLYESYKNSGVEWLGEVPKHWEIHRLKHISEVHLSNVDKHSIDGQKAVSLCNYVDVYKNDRITSEIEFMRETASDEQIKRLSLQKGDVIITKDSEAPSDIGVPALVEEDIPELVCGYHLAIIHPVASVGDYLSYLFRTQFVHAVFEVSATGMTRYALGKYSIENLVFALPSKIEQQTIATFLDRETAKIDALIADQQRLIELLKEKRQAVISHAVTKGLNSDVAMKDTGIEWLGEVPAHWKIMPLKRDLTFLTSGSRGWADHYSEEGALFIRIGNLTRNSIRIDLSDVQRVSVPNGTEGERTKIRHGDVLFSITAYLGSVAVVPENLETAYVSQHVALARLKQQHLLPDWVAYVTLSVVGKTYLETQGYGGTKIQLSLDDVANLMMTVPDIKEQATITHFLNRETAKLDDLTAEAQRAIELLKERRTALISAAVTGKIDVRSLFAVQPQTEAAA